MPEPYQLRMIQEVLPDKFGLIIKSNTSSISKNDDSDIKYYFENFIKNNSKKFLPEFITRQIKNEDNKRIEKILLNFIDDYCKEIRKNIRTSLRRIKRVNLIESYSSLINSFKDKINDLEYFIDDNTFKNKCFEKLFKNVISDPSASISLSKDILDLSYKNKSKYLFLKIKKIDEEFFMDWVTKFLKKCINDKVEDITSLNYPISSNIFELYIFSLLAKFFTQYSVHFDFMQLDVIFKDVYDKILNTIVNIVTENNLIVFNDFLSNDYNTKVIKSVLSLINCNVKEDLQTKLMLSFIEKWEGKKSLMPLCKIFITISKLYNQSFGVLVSLLSKEIAKLIDSSNLYYDIGNILISMIGKQKNDSVEYLFPIISNFSDKNLFFKRYHNELMLRLLSNNIDTKVIDYEQNLVDKLNKCFSVSQRYKLSQTIDDVRESKKFNDHIKNTSNLFCDDQSITKDYIGLNKFENLNIENFFTVNTSFNIWDSTVFSNSTRMDKVKLDLEYVPRSLAKYLIFYSKVFSLETSTPKYLEFYLHTGLVKLNYQTDAGTVFLKMLPVQALILELFDYSSDFLYIIKYFELECLESYDRSEKEKLLDIFIRNKVLYLNNDKIFLNLALESTELNLIDQFFEISFMPDEWDIKRKEETANDLIDIFKTNINSNLKLNDLKINDLIQICQSIPAVDFNQEIFDKAIKYMIDFDLIRLDAESELFSKLLY